MTKEEYRKIIRKAIDDAKDWIDILDTMKILYFMQAMAEDLKDKNLSEVVQEEIDNYYKGIKTLASL